MIVSESIYEISMKKCSDVWWEACGSGVQSSIGKYEDLKRLVGSLFDCEISLGLLITDQIKKNHDR